MNRENPFLGIHLVFWLKEAHFSGSVEAREKGLVALTFDDGPNEQTSLKVLEILNTYGIQATFFWIVENALQLAKANPEHFREIVTLIKTHGHEVGLHAPYDYWPTLLTRLFGNFTREELNDAKEKLSWLTGLPISLYRPHYFQLGPSVKYAQELGLTTVLGDWVSYADAAAPITKQVRNFSQAKPGSILIFHDGTSLTRERTSVLEVLPQVLLNLKGKGFNLTSASKICF